MGISTCPMIVSILVWIDSYYGACHKALCNIINAYRWCSPSSWTKQNGKMRQMVALTSDSVLIHWRYIATLIIPLATRQRVIRTKKFSYQWPNHASCNTPYRINFQNTQEMASLVNVWVCVWVVNDQNNYCVYTSWVWADKLNDIVTGCVRLLVEHVPLQSRAEDTTGDTRVRPSLGESTDKLLYTNDAIVIGRFVNISDGNINLLFSCFIAFRVSPVKFWRCLTSSTTKIFDNVSSLGSNSLTDAISQWKWYCLPQIKSKCVQRQ